MPETKVLEQNEGALVHRETDLFSASNTATIVDVFPWPYNVGTWRSVALYVVDTCQNMHHILGKRTRVQSCGS